MEKLAMIFIYLGLPALGIWLWYIVIHFIIKFW